MKSDSMMIAMDIFDVPCRRPANTIGTASVASLSARAVGVLVARITSGFNFTSSVA